jgi:MFS family permease
MFPQTIVSMIALAPPIMAELIASDLGIRPELTGLYTGLVYAFVLIGNIGAAPLIAAVGPLRLSFACVVTSGLGLALFGLGALPALLLATFLIGMSYGPLTPASSQVMAGQSGSRSFAFIVSVRQTAVPLGGLLAGLLVPALVLRLGWQATGATLGLVSAAAGIALGLALPALRSEMPAGRGGTRRGLLAPLRAIIGSASLLSLSIASMIFGALQLILSSFFVVYLVTIVGHDLVTAGILLGLSQLAGVAGRIGWGFVADRTRAPRSLMVVMGLGMALACAATALLSQIGASGLSVPAAILFGATASGWNGVFLAEIMREVPPEEAGLATSGSLLFTYGGIVFGPPLFGGAAALIGFPAAFAAAAAMAALGAIAVRPRRWTDSAADG